MFRNTAFAALFAASCALAVACGSDDEEPNGGGGAGGTGATGGTGGTGGTGNVGGMGGGNPSACPDHPNVSALQGACAISAPINDPMTQDITLTADITWLLDGPVVVGDDANETTITIQPGTTVTGNDTSFLLIQRHSKIMAQGTKDAPIVFTSAQAVGSRGPQGWGGLVINGLAPINNADMADGTAPGEAGTGRYGGMDPNDNSGILEYVRVQFAGALINEENELNGIAFQGVGDGTKVDFIQAHVTADDAIEFFGGTVNVSHVVATGMNDDGFDWTGGWKGKAQFVLVQHLDGTGDLSEDPRGIEADSNEDNPTKAPISSPTISNVTLLTRAGNDLEGVRFRRGTEVAAWNMIVSGWGACLKVSEPETMPTIKNWVANCPMLVDGDQAMAVVQADGANVVEMDPMLDGWIPMAGSPALGIGAGPDDPFFQTVDFAGAFDGQADWTEGWIETATQ